MKKRKLMFKQMFKQLSLTFVNIFNQCLVSITKTAILLRHKITIIISFSVHTANDTLFYE